MTLALWLVGMALVLVGFAGVVLPALPGAWLIAGGLALAASADGFTRVSMLTVVGISLLALASYGIDFVAASVGAKRLGASPRAMVGATLGTVLGLPLGLVGIVVGPFLGAVIGEWTVHRDLTKAGRAGAGAWVGFAIGTAVKVGVAFVMVGLFLFALIL